MEKKERFYRKWYNDETGEWFLRVYTLDMKDSTVYRFESYSSMYNYMLEVL